MKRRTLLAAPAAVSALAVAGDARVAGAAMALLPAPARVLAIGDSLTVGYGDTPGAGGWPKRFVELAATAGANIQLDSYAVGGWGTTEVLWGLAAVLVSTRPDLVIVSIGTNDAAGGAADVTGFEQRYSRILATVLDVSTALVAPAFMAYSTPPASVVLTQGEALRNDAIFRCLAARGWTSANPAPRLAGIVDFQPVSPNLFDASGIHLNPAGYALAARQVYRGIRGAYGWPIIADEDPSLIDGHRP